MNLGKLSKRLRKELLANPKQAAVLAIVCVVAVWFWSPLLMKWFKGKAKAEAAKAEPAAAVDVVNARQEAQRPWYDIDRWRQADPLTHSALMAQSAPDPFRLQQPTASLQNESEQEEEADRAGAVAIDARQMNLALTAIVSSGSRRFAQINGRTLSEGEEIQIGRGNEQEEEGRSLKGKIVAISRSEVLLDVQGQSLRLSLQPKLLRDGDMVKRLMTH